MDPIGIFRNHFEGYNKEPFFFLIVPDHVWQDTIHIRFGTLMIQGLIEDVISVGEILQTGYGL